MDFISGQYRWLSLFEPNIHVYVIYVMSLTNVVEISEIVINLRHKIKAKLPHIILDFHIGSAFTMLGPMSLINFPCIHLGIMACHTHQEILIKQTF